MVWDTIHARGGRGVAVEEWGGIAYALAGAAAAASGDWRIRPIMKVGHDLEARAWEFLRTLPGLDPEPGVVVVTEPNNRVELHYQDRTRRCERLTGGVPPWQWPELAPLLNGLDALYINFISGFEMDLATAQRTRLAFQGPIYADLHSLFLGVGRGGLRVPRPLEQQREWLRCFDIVQLNEDELGLLVGSGGDVWQLAAEAVGPELRLMLVTLAERGAAYVASPAFTPGPLGWHPADMVARPRIGTAGATRSGRVAVPAAETGAGDGGDPTGCGDVWGASCFLRLLQGDGLSDAMLAANTAAARNVRHLGATGLHLHLQRKIHT